MQQFAYLVFLLISISGLLILDWRFKLAFWHDARRAAITMAIGVGLFVIWDLLGIRLGIFFKGAAQYMLPVELLPEFPIEEIFFLFLICYTALMFYRGFGRWQRIS